MRLTFKVLRKLFGLLIIIAVIVFICTFIQPKRPLSFEEFKQKFKEDKFNHSVKLACEFPKLDAWDPSILQYVQHPAPLNCAQMQPYLTFVDMNGILQFNKTELAHLKKKKYTVKCFYQTFDMSSVNKSTEYDSEIELINATTLVKNMVQVHCSAKNKSGQEIKMFYFNLHAHPTAPKPNKFDKPSENQLSVLLMSIDSMSLSMMKRNMPLTYEYVTKEMGMIVLESFNKVSDNTSPNMVAALMGKRQLQEQDDMPSELADASHAPTGEHLPIIWKEFAEKRYAVIFNEDRPDVGLFEGDTVRSFSKKPVDYYYSPFYTAIHADFASRSLCYYKTFCFRNIPNGDVFVDLSKRNIVALKDYLNFHYSFFVYYSHDDDGIMVEIADRTYFKFWKELFENGYFNKTFIIFMSDHGQRFSKMRSTLIGLLEERNPFVSIWFPDWFYKLHPHIKTNLMINSKRLATTYDIHETLRDVLHANYDGYQRDGSSRAMSLLYTIPVTRTCKSASIPRQYCLCYTQTSLNITAEVLQSAAESLVKTLNDMLSTFKECHVIKLDSITRAEAIALDEKVQLGVRYYLTGDVAADREVDKSIHRIRLAIKTQPNDAAFEAMMVLDQTTKTWSVDGIIQRLNAYKSSSHCVHDKILKMYCTCKELPPNERY